MIAFVHRMLRRGEPALAEASVDDAAAFAVLHAEAFRRGWSEPEFERLLADRQVIAHRAVIGRELAGFIISRLAADEAEILSVVVAPGRRGRGHPRPRLHLHLRRLAGLGMRTAFLEVEEENEPARRLYRRRDFQEVGRRRGYYARPGLAPAAALVLRRNLA